ncbi:MAG: methyltransferase, partial [Phenylobacterium sp.]|nr:methyltransferase [Phenylobacterium sp.]
LVLFLRNLHNWMAAGIAEKAFHDAFVALKPGGVLGVEEHRASPGAVQDVLAADGYVQQAYVIQLAQEAGFILDKTSEINANPRDTKDHPFGVWTLPPVRRSSPRGQPDDPTFNHAKYDAIGESDRMTVRFVKPT